MAVHVDGFTVCDVKDIPSNADIKQKQLSYTKQQMPCANLKEDEAVKDHRVGLLLRMG